MIVGKAKWVCLGLVVWVLWSVGVGAEARRLPEINYAARFCLAEGGVLEERFTDGGTTDCSTDTHVIEAGFGDKARESVNQVERYMYHDQEKRKGGILLILENDTVRPGADVEPHLEYPMPLEPPDPMLEPAEPAPVDCDPSQQRCVGRPMIFESEENRRRCRDINDDGNETCL